MHSTCIFLSDIPVPDKPVCDIVDQENTFFCTIWPSWLTNKQNKMNCELMLTYDTPALRQTGSRNLTCQKTLPTIWGTYMKLVTKYQIPIINSCLKKGDEKYLGRMEGRTEVKQYTLLPLRGAGV